MRLKLAAAVLALAASAADAQRVAIQRMNNLGGAPMISGGGHAFGSNGTYVQPTLVNNYAIAAGDSRAANSGAFPAWSSPTFTVVTNYSNGYTGWLYPLSGNKFLAETGWNYGVGSQTTAGIAGRLYSTTQYCNDSQAIGAACFSDASATLNGTISANPSAPLTINLSSVSGTPAAGDYIIINGAANFGCPVTSYNSATPSVTVPANCINGAAASGAAVAFAHPAHASAFTTYAPFQASGTSGASVTDVDTNKVNGGAYFGGAYSIVTDPAQILFLIAGTNDGNRGSSNTIFDFQSIFNAYGPSGANKIVIVGDEMPRGLAEGYSRSNAAINGSPEVWTIPTGSPYTVTVTNSANYYDTQQVFYAPCGTTTSGTPANTYSCGTGASGVTFAAGASDGTALTQVASNPSAGQYSVASGVYTFNSADAGKKIAIWYRWTNNTAGSGSNYLTTIHDWLNSTQCGSWTDPLSSTTYSGVSGAQCAGFYLWVHVASTWATLLDTATGTSNYNLPYTLVDGLHPTPYGGALTAKAMLAAASASLTSQPGAPYAVATANNTFFNGTTTTSTAAQTSTCPTQNKSYYISSVVVGGTGGTALTSISAATAAVLFPVGAKLYFQNTSVAPGSNGLSVTCVDVTNGLIQMSGGASYTMTGSTSNWAMAQADGVNPASFVGNGIYGNQIYNYQTNTASPLSYTLTPSGSMIGATVKQGVPWGWTFAPDSGSTTAISKGILGLAYGVEQNPFGDGLDDFVIQLSGYPSTGQQVVLSQNIQPTLAAAFAAGSAQRAICRVKISAGPNGHLYGLTGVQVKFLDQNNGTFIPPGLSSGSYTIWSAIHGGGSISFNDASLWTGAPGVTSTSLGNVLTLDELTPQAQVQGSSTNNQSQMSFVVTYAAGDPVSATIRLQSCRAMQVSQ
jgi:hypothetical protein